MDNKTMTFSYPNNEGQKLAYGRPALPGMRRSCSECGRKKKSCDGQQPCGRCVRSGNECTYSKRRWHLPKPHQEQRQRQGPDRDGAHDRDLMLQSSPPGVLSTTGRALATTGRIPLKRVRLSASPATGLVGMRENAFLGDFFACIGLLPLATQSQMREAMVRMMTAVVPRQWPAVGGDSDDTGRHDAIVRGEDGSKASEWTQLPMNPSTCTFWCAIALGAIAKGNPLESVAKYSRLAHEALAKSTQGSSDAEVAKAWAMLAYLHSFMGDVARYQDCLALSESFVRNSVEHSSTDSLPVGFAEVANYVEIGDSCCELRHKKSPTDAEGQPPPQLNKAATEGEIYRYVAQCVKSFEQAVHATANEQSGKTGETMSEAEDDGPSDRVRPPDSALQSKEMANAMGTVLSNGRCLDVEPLEEVVDRPGIGGGMGSLLINLSLLFVKAAKGDLDASLERISRCIEVFEQFPGLCRSTMGYHKAHMVLVCLAVISDSRAQSMYDRLRGCYNSFLPVGSLPVPPLEEWQGVGAFCDDFYCRAAEDLVASKHIKAFSAQLVDTIDVSDGTEVADIDKGEADIPGHGQIQREMPEASNNPQRIIGPLSEWPTEIGAVGGMTPSWASATPIASPGCSHYPCNPSEAVLHSDNVENSGAVMAPEMLPILPELSEGGGLMEDTEDDGIGAANWLDVTHAMLGAL
ncbi:unnamed protein product [Ectocarpus fasciculatus]